jgi:hypothetical protein
MEAAVQLQDRIARPTLASAAASVRMRMNMIWPSGCSQRLPATTNASAVAFIITSRLISTNSKLRRTSTPMSPSVKRTPATSRPCSIGIPVIASSLEKTEFGFACLSQGKKSAKSHYRRSEPPVHSFSSRLPR